ncbi:MAG: molybdenum cofactor guanylyltransferase [Bacteroidales bacterium]|nr:molybdenum cofactor guanylyltransferase [Bacteroidales bacterium]
MFASHPDDVILFSGPFARNVTGIILAGGGSRRMKSEKGLMIFRGRPMIEYVLSALEPVCKKLLISTSHQGYMKYGYPLIVDEIPGMGPLSGIVTCMKHSGGNDFIVAACDLPYLNPELIRYILCHKTEFQALVPVWGGQIRPLCSYYQRSIIPFAEKCIRENRLAMVDFLQEIRAGWLHIPKEHPLFSTSLFRNINSLSDL